MSTIDNADLAKRLEELEERVLQYKMMQLPGQPMITHMGTSYLIDDLLTALKELSALRAQEGWRLAPVEPTEAMLAKGAEQITGYHLGTMVATARFVYRAMIAAAPQEAGR